MKNLCVHTVERRLRRGNDWKSQPRDRETGRWMPRKSLRREILHLRLTRSERRMIEDAADRRGITLTELVVRAVEKFAGA